MKQIRLEELLRNHVGKDKPYTTNQFMMVARDEGNKITIYIYPFGVDGETLDFEVKGNVLWPVR